jgi:hypothetical protein
MMKILNSIARSILSNRNFSEWTSSSGEDGIRFESQLELKNVFINN